MLNSRFAPSLSPVSVLPPRPIRPHRLGRPVAQGGVLATHRRARRHGAPVVGALQAWASVSRGLWFARSPEFIHRSLIHFLVWMRVPGDVVFGALARFAFALWRG